MKKIVWVMISLFILLMVFLFVVFNLNSERNLELGISLTKNTYEVGELVEGEFFMSYEGEPFEGIVIYSESREDCSKKHYSISKGTIKTGSFEDGTLSGFRQSLDAFKINNVGNGFCNYVAGTDYFFEEGTYVYEISVYDCSTIENELDKGCSEFFEEFSGIFSDRERTEALTPLKSLTKTVLVSGGDYVSECKSNDECTETCNGCENGKQLCRMPSEVCSDCISDFNCKEGYVCENNVCVLG